jgi:PAS domain S-box-containing protein
MEKVVLQLKWRHQFQFAGYYAAQQQGFYREEGLAVEIRESTPDDPPIPALLNREVQYAVSDPDALLARLQGKPVVALAVTHQHSPLVFLTRNRGINKPADLVGRTIMINSSLGAALLKAMLIKEGIPPERVTLVKHTWKVSDLIGGNADAMTAYATELFPEFRQPEVRKPGVINPRSYGIDFYGDTLITSEEEISRRPDRVAAFRRASLKGWGYAFTHVDAMVEQILRMDGVSQRGITREVLKHEAAVMQDLVQPLLVEIGHMNPGRWQHMADTLVSLGMASGKKPLEGFLYDPHAEPRWKRHMAAIFMAGVVLVLFSLVLIEYLRRTIKQRTVQLETEAKLRYASEDRFRAIYDAVNDAIFIHEPETGAIVDVNQRMCDMYGMSRDEALQATVGDLSSGEPPHTHDAAIAWIKKAVAGRPQLFEWLGRHKDGHLFWVEVNMKRATIGGLNRVLVVARDITQRKWSEQALLREKAFSDTIIDSLPGIFYICDDTGQLVRWNSNEKEVTGYSPQELSQMNVLQLFQTDRDLIRERIREVFESGRAEVEASIVTKSGMAIPFYLTGFRMAVDDKRYLVGVGIDISERKQLERQLQQAQKMEAIGILAGGVAHDFNNILSAIIGYASLLRFKMAPEDPLRHSVEQILASAERAANLTKSLLAFSRKQIVDLKLHDVNTIIANLHTILSRLIGEDIAFTTELAQEPLTVSADRVQFEQVVMNLVTNARDAMPKGGTLRISTERVIREGDNGELTARPYALISISDTGTGMDDAALDHVFEPFYTTKEPGKGTGLGLAIAYGIIKKHGGTINVESRTGKGTRFMIYLPCIPDAARSADSDAQDQQLAGNETILLVEDDPSVRQTIRDVLEEFGYRVLDAFDGDDAVRVFRQHQERIDLVLCDIIMPSRNGRAVFEEIKEIRPGIKVVYMSGYTADVIAEKGILEEGSAFIAKPLNPHALLGKIREVMDRP